MSQSYQHHCNFFITFCVNSFVSSDLPPRPERRLPRLRAVHRGHGRLRLPPPGAGLGPRHRLGTAGLGAALKEDEGVDFLGEDSTQFAVKELSFLTAAKPSGPSTVRVVLVVVLVVVGAVCQSIVD